jgi:hypothetical protein
MWLWAMEDMQWSSCPYMTDSNLNGYHDQVSILIVRVAF